MAGVDWRVYTQLQAPDILGRVQQGMSLRGMVARLQDQEEDRKRKKVQKNILAGFAKDPKGTIEKMWPQNPELAMKLGESHLRNEELRGKNELARDKNELARDKKELWANDAKVGVVERAIKVYRETKGGPLASIKAMNEHLRKNEAMNLVEIVDKEEAEELLEKWVTLDDMMEDLEELRAKGTDLRSKVGIAKPKPMSKEGKLQWDIDQGYLQPGAGVEGKAKPLSDLGKYQRDFENGNISAEQRDNAIKKSLGGMTPKDRQAAILSWGSRFHSESQGYMQGLAAFERVKEAAKLKTGQGDQLLVMSFVNAVDNTAAREGEVKLSMSTAGLVGSIEAFIKRLQSGQMLTEVQRQGFIQATASVLIGVGKTQDQREASFRKSAKFAGFDDNAIEAILGRVPEREDLRNSAEEASAPTAAVAKPATLEEARALLTGTKFISPLTGQELTRK